MAKQQPSKTKLSTQSTKLSTSDIEPSVEIGVEDTTADVPQEVETTSFTKRNLTGKKEIFTDLFKLMVSKVIKYEGWDEVNEHPDTHPQKFSTWEHTHPFRTYDKKGDKMNICTPIGGHFHIVEWFVDPNDPEKIPKIKSVSPPMVMGKEKIKGRFVQKPVLANEYDDHTHDVEYLRSSKIEFSTTNVEAQKVIAYEASKTAPLQGVTER